MSVLALIPARSGSKGIPGKNLRTLGGKTLIQHAVDCAYAARVSKVAVSSDIYLHTSTFTNGVGHQSIHLARPPDLAQDDTPMVAVVRHVLEQIPGPDDQVIVLLQPTQPFRTPAHVQAAIALLRETQADSVVSVVELPKTHHPEFQIVKAGGRLFLYESPNAWSWQQLLLPQRRQDVDPTYIRDGTVYAFWRQTVSRHGTIYGQDVRPLIIPAEESCELDTEADWQQVEARWRAQHG